MAAMNCRSVGIVGFGKLGQYLFEEVQKIPEFKVAFVWNRSVDKMRGVVPVDLILHDLTDCASRSPDIIVEVAHPLIVAQHGICLLDTADFLVGSPTALADDSVYQALLKASKKTGHGLYIASGALWGAHDIQKMADRGMLLGLKVTMKKHPSCFKVCGHLVDLLASIGSDPLTLYEGHVRDLCVLAPNNVNTMACAAIAAHNLGFDQVIGCLIADPSLSCHIVEVEVEGPPGSEGNQFTVHTIRMNPAAAGGVTGKLTFASFLSSLIKIKATRYCSGVQIC